MKYPLSIRSQTSHPEGLYKLTEVVHQDGKRMEAGYKQYRYCQDGSSLVFTYSPSVLERAFTFSVSKADDKGVQVIDTSDSTFTYRWYNDRDSSNEHLFPYQTTIDEEYIPAGTEPIADETTNEETPSAGRLETTWQTTGELRHLTILD